MLDLIRCAPSYNGKTCEFMSPRGWKVTDTIRKTGKFYEYDLLDAIAKMNLKSVYVNVGAHIGNHTIFFAECCPSDEVIAIEPSLSNFLVLEQNVKGKEKIKIVNAAAGASSIDQLEFAPSEPSGMSHDLKTIVTQPKEVSNSVTVDEIVGDKNVSIIKIDINGDPTEVLSGAEETIQRCRPVLAVDCGGEQYYCKVAAELAKRMYVSVNNFGGSEVAIFIPATIHVAFPMFNRVDVTLDLLGDFEREVEIARKAGASVYVTCFDDGSTEKITPILEFFEKKPTWDFISYVDGPHGKKGFWKVITGIFRNYRSCKSTDMFCLTANDVRLCNRFFERALTAWNSIDRDRNRAALNVQAEKYRDHIQQWTHFEPYRHNELVWKTQWNDGMLFAPISTLQTVNFEIPEPDPARWKNPNISSGVWQWFSKELHGRAMGMYQVHQALDVHVMAPSSMHGDLRKKEHITSTRFIDGEGAHVRLWCREPIRASLASIPSRKENLEKVVESLLPQVDELCVYLNGYDHVPSCLRFDGRIKVGTSALDGDLGDAGKFFWCESGSGYFFTCDDDLIYPEDYVMTMIQAIEKYDRKAVVGLHGVILNPPPRKNYYDCRRVMHWLSPLKDDRVVHLLGTGTVAYHSSTIQLKKAMFEAPNMADIWLGLACQAANVPMISVARRAEMLTLLDCPFTIYEAQHGKDQVQLEAINRINWQINRVKP